MKFVSVIRYQYDIGTFIVSYNVLQDMTEVHVRIWFYYFPNLRAAHSNREAAERDGTGSGVDGPDPGNDFAWKI